MILLGQGIRYIVGGNANDNTFAVNWDGPLGQQKLGLFFDDEVFSFPNGPQLAVEFVARPSERKERDDDRANSARDAGYPVSRIAAGNAPGLRELGLVALLATLDFVQRHDAAHSGDALGSKQQESNLPADVELTKFGLHGQQAAHAFNDDGLFIQTVAAAGEQAGHAHGSLITVTLPEAGAESPPAFDAAAAAQSALAGIDSPFNRVVAADLVGSHGHGHGHDASAASAHHHQVIGAAPVFDLPNLVIGTDRDDILVGNGAHSILFGGDGNDLLVADRADLAADLAIAGTIRALQASLAAADDAAALKLAAEQTATHHVVLATTTTDGRVASFESQPSAAGSAPSAVDLGSASPPIPAGAAAATDNQGAAASTAPASAAAAGTGPALDQAHAALALILGAPQDNVILLSEVIADHGKTDAGNGLFSGSSGSGSMGSPGNSGTGRGSAGGSGPSGQSGSDDDIDGGDGDDIIDGGRGDDMLSGGMGNDAFIFRHGFGQDVISDFGYTRGNHDFIYFEHGMFVDFDDLVQHMNQVDDYVVIAASENDHITLQHFDKINLSAHDSFVFA